MICPNCDNILNVNGCQACGWRMGDPFPAHRLAEGTAHPLKSGDGLYPSRTGEAKVVPIVSEPVAGKPVAVEVPLPESVATEAPKSGKSTIQ